LNRSERKSNRGFTLIEVLLVILIIGMLAGVVVVTISGTSEGAKIDTTELKVKKLETKLGEYYVHVGHYPTESEGGLEALRVKPNFDDEKTAERWRGPYVKSQELLDAWNNKINYEPAAAGAEVAPGVKFKLWSNGPDGQSNTADDITNFEDEQK
jgi:general secretion pathway protein G